MTFELSFQVENIGSASWTEETSCEQYGQCYIICDIHRTLGSPMRLECKFKGGHKARKRIQTRLSKSLYFRLRRMEFYPQKIVKYAIENVARHECYVSRFSSGKPKCVSTESFVILDILQTSIESRLQVEILDFLLCFWPCIFQNV